MPSFDVSVTLKTSYHQGPTRRWAANDIHDSDAVSSTIPYCDVVLTDRAVAAHAAANRARGAAQHRCSRAALRPCSADLPAGAGGHDAGQLSGQERCANESGRKSQFQGHCEHELVRGGRRGTRTLGLLHVKHFRLSAVLGAWQRLAQPRQLYGHGCRSAAR